MARDNSYLVGNKFAKGCGPNRTSFKPENPPWNKGVKGLRLSPQTEFKKGQKGINWLPVGSVRVRRDKGKGQPRAYIKVAEPNIWKLRAVLVWEKENGPVPKGFVVHHKNENSLEDVIENLCALTRAQHLMAHEKSLRVAAKASPKRMGWGPGGKRIAWRESWMALEKPLWPRSGR